LGELIFTADAGEGAPPVHHIGLCYEFSKAGDRFNEKNRQHLLQSLEHRNSLGSELVLTDALCAELSRLMPKFVNIEATAPEDLLATSDQALRVEFQAGLPLGVVVDEPGYKLMGTVSLELSQEGARVAMKTRGVISPLGEIIAHDVSFDPIVNVYDRARDTGVARLIRIECPGVTNKDLGWEELPNGVKISIDKKRPISEHAVQPVWPIRQHHGVWEREFSFDNKEGRFEMCEDEGGLKNGVLTVVLKKSMQPRRGTFGGAHGTGMHFDPDRVASPTASEARSWAAVSSAGA
jgi:HSP20 family molecular chaperone IbpA